MTLHRSIFIVVGFLCCSYFPVAQVQQVNDEPFWQEYHEGFTISDPKASNEVRNIAVDNDQQVWIATPTGVYVKKENHKAFTTISKEIGPAFSVTPDNAGNVWIGTWNKVYVFGKNGLKEVAGTSGPIAVICTSTDGTYVMGPRGVWLFNGSSFIKKSYNIARSIRNAHADALGNLWVATDAGLYRIVHDKVRRVAGNLLISAAIKDVAADKENNVWAAGLGGVTVINKDKQVKKITPLEGCPSIFVNTIMLSPVNDMWVGTNAGVVRFTPGGLHSLLFSRRWLMDDKVNSMAFDKNGTAWIGTMNGVSAIKKRTMTLVQKSAYFYDVLMRRHIREPWIAGQCRLEVPGDTTSWKPDDDDNDGEYTGNYLAMESFRYAATKSEQAKENARKAFDFLRKLQEVAGNKGYFARTMVPADWNAPLHDGNRNYSETELAEELVKEPRFKPVEERWRKSADGKWLWKGDASSDEMCGHMMGYFFYYELAADDKQKVIIAKHVSGIVDHLVENKFNMMDIDGTHTRWSVWSPEMLNHDPEWLPDRYQNSMELLAFLKLAYHVTGDNKYQEHYLHLIKKENYLANMSKIKEQDPAWFIYFDVILQAYLYPILLKCEKDPVLLAFYRKQMDEFMERRKGDKNPLINFLYCYATNKKTELPASVELLRETPLDLVSWHIDHTKREDVQIVRHPVLDELQVSELPPASIRATIRWDANPWAAVNGSPDIEREPVFWLLPYWIGRYLKMIRR